MGVGIKIPDGQTLHMGKDICPQPLHGSLAYIDHQPGVGIGSRHADPVKSRHPQDGVGQTGKIRIRRCQQGHNVRIDQGFGKHGALHVGQHADHNADQHHDAVNQIMFGHILHKSPQKLHGVFDFRGRPSVTASRTSHGLSARLSLFFCLCHYASPPFSSKSPEPPIWASYTSR